MNWDWNFAFTILPEVKQGLLVTITATVFGSALAMVLGLLMALGRRSKSAALKNSVNGVTEFLRRTPLLVLLYFIFYMLPEVNILIPPLIAGIVALGLQSSAYMSEIYRAGIDAIPRGQWEAAVALNYSKVKLWTKVILPQAVPPMTPAIGNYVILMFKDSSLLSVISVVELMGVGRNLGNETYRYLEPITLIAGIYFVLSQLAAWFFRWIERRTKWD